MTDEPRRLSVEEEDPAAAIRALQEGIADRERRVGQHQAEIARHTVDIGYMRETLGMVKARHPELANDA